MAQAKTASDKPKRPVANPRVFVLYVEGDSTPRGVCRTAEQVMTAMDAGMKQEPPVKITFKKYDLPRGPARKASASA
jgi:hypothetical protein